MATSDLETVRERLKNGDLKAKIREDGLSDVWDKFLIIVDENDRSVGFVKCGSCEVIYKYDARKTGTSNMVRHQCGRRRRRKHNRDPQHEAVPDDIFAPITPWQAGEISAEMKPPTGIDAKKPRKPLHMEDDISLYILHLERKMRKIRDPRVLLELQNQIDQACFQALMSQIPSHIPNQMHSPVPSQIQIDTQNPMNHQVGNSFQ